MSILIVVDPGHGGKDPGVVVAGRRECDTNLLAAQALRGELLRYGGVQVQLTHQGHPIDFQGAQRAALANSVGANLLVSLHADSSSQAATRGHHVIYSLRSDRRLAQCVSDALGAATGQAACRQPWTRALPAQPDQDWYAIIRNAKMPAIIVERGFLTNSEEAALLSDPEHLARQARGTAAGIAGYFGLGRMGAVFKDVPTNNPYYAAIEAAKQLGLVAGYPDGTLGADEVIRTDRMVALLHRLYVRLATNAAVLADSRVQQVIARCKPAVVQIVTDAGTGAGSIIRTDGYILTNEHLVKNGQGGFGGLRVRVVTGPPGLEQLQEYPATAVATTEFAHLALLHIQATELRELPIIDRAPIEGQTVLVIGHPHGYQSTSSKGIVAQDGALLDGRFLVDAAIHPGNSGGPVLNLDGEIIGVAEANVGEADNLGLAICAKRVREFLQSHLPGLVK